jgi:catechol 2,3-dioxygenase-like lactoylglutathione lyase family enzyme
MAVQFNHTLVAARDRHASAAYLAEMLGLPKPTTYGSFRCVELANGASLDFVDVEEVHAQHYAFLVDEPEFDEIFGRIKERGATYWADPHRQRAGEWNTGDGGRGVYWEDPSGHLLEIITRAYGAG